MPRALSTASTFSREHLAAALGEAFPAAFDMALPVAFGAALRPCPRAVPAHERVVFRLRPFARPHRQRRALQRPQRTLRHRRLRQRPKYLLGPPTRKRTARPLLAIPVAPAYVNRQAPALRTDASHGTSTQISGNPLPL